MYIGCSLGGGMRRGVVAQPAVPRGTGGRCGEAMARLCHTAARGPRVSPPPHPGLPAARLPKIAAEGVDRGMSDRDGAVIMEQKYECTLGADTLASPAAAVIGTR